MGDTFHARCLPAAAAAAAAAVAAAASAAAGAGGPGAIGRISFELLLLGMGVPIAVCASLRF